MNNIALQKTKMPDKPGVYFFLRGKEILYIGKATSLKDRVKSYFGKDLIGTRGPILVDMVFKADKIDWQATDSVLEALILEASLIKKHQPYFNTKEKDDKSFNYVCITKTNLRDSVDGLPKIIIIRGRLLMEVNNYKFQSVFGPFTSGTQLREAMKIIRPIFPFLDDKSKNYYKFYKQVDLAPDLSSEEGIKQYKNNIKNLKLFFEGKKKKVLKNLEKEMKTYAKVRKFEQAGNAKRKIFALKHINDVALLKNEYTRQKSSNSRIEAYDIAHLGGKNMVGVMTVVEDGEAVKGEYKKFKIRTQAGANDTRALKEILERRLRHSEWLFPSLIVVDGSIAQINVAEGVLAKLNLDIPVVAVVKDERHKPKSISGNESLVLKYKKDILLANSESHRFAINYHKNMRNRNFLK